jgi:rhamnogalacturonyl hydrolase YesR
MAGNTFAKQPFSGELKKNNIEEVCNAVVDWQIANHPQNRHHSLSWTNGALYIGMFKWGETAENESCFQFIDSIGKKNNWVMHKRVYHADDICVGQAFIEMHKKYKKKEMLQPVMERAFYVAHHPSTAPLMKDHPVGRNDRWSWCDALFMAPPVYAALYSLTGDEIYLEYMDKEFKECVDSLYDKEEKLFYRDRTRIPKREPNGAKQFWGRGNGWVFGGIPLIIDNLPEGHPGKKYYVDLFKELAVSILQTQDKNGAWHASLLDPDSYPMPENSASAFMCYGFAWGIRNGYLDKKTYGTPLKKAWQSLVSHVSADGKLGFIQPVGAAPNSVDKNSTDVYGIGAFLLAGSELYKLTNK